jgi:hypothetical protein
LCGTTLFIPAGTELGVLSSCDEPVTAKTLRIRFCEDTRIQVGHRQVGRIAEKYSLEGLLPVVLNGVPLLQVTNTHNASLSLRLAAGQRPVLRLIGLVSPYKQRGQQALYHVTETLAQRILGGVALQVNT